MRPPFPSAAQAYAESIDSDTASRHHPNSRLTILPLPSLAALYPLDDNHDRHHHHHHHNHTHNHNHTHTRHHHPDHHTHRSTLDPSTASVSSPSSSASASSSASSTHSDPSYPFSASQTHFSHRNQHSHPHQNQHQNQPSQRRSYSPYQSYDKQFPKSPSSSRSTHTTATATTTTTTTSDCAKPESVSLAANAVATSPAPAASAAVHLASLDDTAAAAEAKTNKSEYMGTNMESLLDAIEVATSSPSSSSSSCGSPSPSNSTTGSSVSPLSAPTSPSTSPLDAVTVSTRASHGRSRTTFLKDVAPASNPTLRRMSISNLVDGDDSDSDLDSRLPVLRDPPQPEENHRPRLKPMIPRPVSPANGGSTEIHKRKWSRLSTYSIEHERTSKIRRSIQGHVDLPEPIRSPVASVSVVPTADLAHDLTRASTTAMRLTASRIHGSLANRRQMTTISCYHASVAQKSYGSEKRFLCPPPIVHINGPLDDSSSGLSNKPQVTMSVICEGGENGTLGQRSTLEEDQTSTFRYLYVSGTAKAKSFQLKLQVYGRSCLPNGFLSGDLGQEGYVVRDSELPEPYATFDSAPIAIISKPSKKTAKARNVSSCILAGSLVSLFNRINSQTVRTKYMTVQDGSLCAKSSTWSSFTITIVSNGPCSPAPARTTSSKSHHRQPVQQTASPITYGAEIILTETVTGLQSDRLVVCKVENGRILDGAIGPICQMQKVALMSTEQTQDGRPLYLGAVGEDHQNGRFMDHSSNSNAALKYHISTYSENSKPGSDDFLCWTIVGISKFEYSYFESLPGGSNSSEVNSAEMRSLVPRPITPFPTLAGSPVYNAASHTLEFSVSNFYSSATETESTPVPLQVWLGSTGPLNTHIIRRSPVSSAEGSATATSATTTDQTTALVDLPQGSQLNTNGDPTPLSMPLLFVRSWDGITYDSRAKVTFNRHDDHERWSVQLF